METLTSEDNGYISMPKINSNFTELEGDITAINGTLSSLDSDVDTLQEDVATINSDLDTAQQDIVTLQGEVSGGSNTFFDVTDYGAVGDGIVDDTSSVQSAFTAVVNNGGGCVYFPAGLYSLNAQITASNVPIKVMGDGIGVSQLRWESTATTVGISIYEDEDVKTVTIDGLSLFTKNTTGVAIYLNFDDQISSGVLVNRSSQRFLIQNVNAQGWDDDFVSYGWHTGIEVSSPMVGNVINFHMQGRVTPGSPMINESTYGIFVHAMNSDYDNGHPVEVICDKCSIYNVKRAIWLQYLEGAFVNNCNLVGVDYGVYFNDNYGRPQLNVANSHINAYLACILGYNCNEATIIGNLLYRTIDATTTGMGINLTGTSGIGSNYFVVTGNTFEDNAAGTSNMNGIVIDYGTYGVIVSNVFRKVLTAIWLTSNSSYCKGSQNVYASAGATVTNSGTGNVVT